MKTPPPPLLGSRSIVSLPPLPEVCAESGCEHGRVLCKKADDDHKLTREEWTEALPQVESHSPRSKYGLLLRNVALITSMPTH